MTLGALPGTRPRHSRSALPSAVRCSVMSVSHRTLDAAAVNWRSTRSSWTGGPGLTIEAEFLCDHRPDPLLRAQPGNPVLASDQAAVAQFVTSG